MSSEKNAQKNNQILAAIVLHAQDILSESIDFMYGCSLIGKAVKELGNSVSQKEFEHFVKFQKATHHISIRPDWKTSVMTDTKNELHQGEAKFRDGLWNACKAILKKYHQ